MTSTRILIFHTTLLIGFIILSVASSVIAITLPHLLPGKYLLFSALALMGLVLGSWAVYGGCPFTVWENKYRERENPGSSYKGPCIDRYIKEWFGIRLPAKVSTIVLIGFLLFPATTGLLNW